MAAPQIITPKPPLNLFEAKRATITDTWTTLYNVPEYVIPAAGVTPEQTVKAAAIMTGILISHNGTATRKVSVQILDVDDNAYSVVHEADVFPNDILVVSLDRQVMQSGEQLQVKMTSGETADVHFTYILNTREVYTEIV
jgi:hypothetical protein